MSEFYKDDNIDFNKYIEGVDEEYREMLTNALENFEEMNDEEFQDEEDLKDVIEDLSKGDIIDMMEDLKIPVQTYITDVTDKENLELKDLSVDDLKSISKALLSRFRNLKQNPISEENTLEENYQLVFLFSYAAYRTAEIRKKEFLIKEKPDQIMSFSYAEFYAGKHVADVFSKVANIIKQINENKITEDVDLDSASEYLTDYVELYTKTFKNEIKTLGPKHEKEFNELPNLIRESKVNLEAFISVVTTVLSYISVFCTLGFSLFNENIKTRFMHPIAKTKLDDLEYKYKLAKKQINKLDSIQKQNPGRATESEK